MGDHYMVTLMQQRLMNHLWGYIVLRRSSDEALHPFDAEVLRVRAEDAAKGFWR